MIYRDFAKSLLMHPGIVRMEQITDGVLKDIQDIEYSPANIGFVPNDPIGLQDIEDKDLKLILFCSNEFKMFTEPFMDLVDSRGELVGHDVLEAEVPKYAGKDYVWLTRNLFIDTRLITEHHIKCLIRSLSFDLDGIPDDVRPRVFYPCSTTANSLNRKFGITGKISATVLLGVDNVEF